MESSIGYSWLAVRDSWPGDFCDLAKRAPDAKAIQKFKLHYVFDVSCPM